MWEELNRPKDRPEDPQRNEEDNDDGAGLPIGGIVGGAIAIAAVVFAGFIVMGGGEVTDETPAAAAADGSADGELALVDGDDEAAVDGAVDEAGAEGPDADTIAMAMQAFEALPSDSYSPAVPAGAEGNYTVLSRGKLYLRGEIPNPMIAVGAVAALEEILGEGNVISEYTINPDAPFEMGRASDVFIEDTVLFASGSAEIAPDFYPLLGLGVVLMQLQDGVTIEVIGHTDSNGDDDFNLLLSQDRVDAVKAFWVSQGADPERITAIGRGENDPVADNATAEGRQLNRRVEIVITGFTFSM